MSDFLLGYIPERQCRTPEQTAAMAELRSSLVEFDVGGPVPREVRHRPWIAPTFTRNQGPLPSCVGHGSSSGAFLLNRIDCMARGVDSRLAMSARYSWITAQKNCGMLGRNTGATISGASKAARTDGFCRESVLPYKSVYDPRPTEEAVAEGRDHPLLGNVTDLKGDPDRVRQYLGTGTGVMVIGAKWTAGLASCAATRGYVQSVGGQMYGYHCTLCTGYFEDRGTLWFEFLNSHGTGFGDQGFYYLPRNLMLELMRDPNSEWHGWTDMTEYGPVRDMGWASTMRFG